MKMRKFCSMFLLLVWLSLTVFAWFRPADAMSDSERRPLAQMPQFTAESLLNGKFMKDFESYSLDQFPLRDSFRTVKALFATHILGQKDNNGIYIAENYAVKQEYPLKPDSVLRAAERFTYVYEKYLTDSRCFYAIVPDKGQYLAESSGHLTLHFGKMNTILGNAMPWAAPINLFDSLNYEDFYRTDTHWKQETLFNAAKVLCDALGVTAPDREDFTQTTIDRPFYGVYYGQAALPMEPDVLSVMESDLLSECTVYDHESGKTGSVYDESKLESKDLYDIFLSGSRSLLTIENPNASTEKELIVFRDSFGSAMIPLLLTDYARVTAVDIRYIHPDLLDRFVDFHGQDVLFLYSTLVLNNSETIK